MGRNWFRLENGYHVRRGSNDINWSLKMSVKYTFSNRMPRFSIPVRCFDLFESKKLTSFRVVFPGNRKLEE